MYIVLLKFTCHITQTTQKCSLSLQKVHVQNVGVNWRPLSAIVYKGIKHIFTVQKNDKCTIINILEPESTLYYKELKLKAISNVTFIPGCLNIYLKNEELLTV